MVQIAHPPMDLLPLNDDSLRGNRIHLSDGKPRQIDLLLHILA